jgi:hypothetical protein
VKLVIIPSIRVHMDIEAEDGFMIVLVADSTSPEFQALETFVSTLGGSNRITRLNPVSNMPKPHRFVYRIELEKDQRILLKPTVDK